MFYWIFCSPIKNQDHVKDPCLCEFWRILDYQWGFVNGGSLTDDEEDNGDGPRLDGGSHGEMLDDSQPPNIVEDSQLADFVEDSQQVDMEEDHQLPDETSYPVVESPPLQPAEEPLPDTEVLPDQVPEQPKSSDSSGASAALEPVGGGMVEKHADLLAKVRTLKPGQPKHETYLCLMF